MVFTGIVQEKARLMSVEKLEDFSSIEIGTSSDFMRGIKIGASVSIDGVCLTVTSIKEKSLTFDIIVETLKVTNLSNFCLLYTSPSPRDLSTSRMPSSA